MKINKKKIGIFLVTFIFLIGTGMMLLVKKPLHVLESTLLEDGTRRITYTGYTGVTASGSSMAMMGSYESLEQLKQSINQSVGIEVTEETDLSIVHSGGWVKGKIIGPGISYCNYPPHLGSMGSGFTLWQTEILEIENFIKKNDYELKVGDVVWIWEPYFLYEDQEGKIRKAADRYNACSRPLEDGEVITMFLSISVVGNLSKQERTGLVENVWGQFVNEFSGLIENGKEWWRNPPLSWT